jgi:transposase
MKFGLRIPSPTKRIAARTSPARFIRHSLGLKTPRGMGWLTNPKRAAYNRIYNRTTFGCLFLALGTSWRSVRNADFIPPLSPTLRPYPKPGVQGLQ